MSEKRSAATIFIFITILIDAIGFGVIIPVMPSLISELAQTDTGGAARYGGLLFAAYSVTQFIFSPIVGGLSDQFGRRPILLASLFGFGVDYVFLIFAPTITWLFIGRVIAGIMGASFTTAAAYMADVSPPEKRAQNFGMIGAAFGLGFIIGPSIGALASTFGVRVPFMVSGVLTLCNWLYGYFILPESLKIENRRKFDWKRANPVGALINLRRFPMLLGFVAALFLVYIANFSTQGTWSFFVKERFNWNSREIGLSLTFIGVMIAIVQGGLTRVVIPKLGAKKSIYVGFTFSILGSIAFAFANQGWMMYAIMVPFALGGLAGPAMQGIISNEIPANEQGELQGSLTSLNSVAAIIGPILMTSLFYQYTSKDAPIYFPGIPFVAAAILSICSLVLIGITLKKNEAKH